MRNVIQATIKDAKEQVSHFGEVVIDLASDNEAWANVPLVEHAVKILKIKDAYKTNKIKRNYADFIHSINALSDIDKTELFRRFNPDEKDAFPEETAEVIFDVIADSQKPVKARVLGNLLGALARKEINQEEYDTLSLIVQGCPVVALIALPDFLESNNWLSYQSGFNPSVYESRLFSLGVGTRHGNMFRLDALGIKLAKHGFNLGVVN